MQKSELTPVQLPPTMPLCLEGYNANFAAEAFLPIRWVALLEPTP